jgi:outer membrane protein OmpA-like peptidoglycan-associated protein
MKIKILWLFCFLGSIQIARAQSKLICSLYFENGLSTIQVIEKSKLQAALGKFDSTRRYNFEIVAYADQVGNAKANLKLAENRAKSVQTELIALLPNATIVVKPIGEIGSTHIDSLKYNRRVDVFRTVYVKPKRNLAKDDIIIGESIVLTGILFVGGSSELLSSSYKPLDSLVTILKERNEYVVSLLGHYNPFTSFSEAKPNPNEDEFDNKTGLKNLSFARANAVMDYFIANGIGSSRLACFGLKGTQPISKIEGGLNRRVEVVLRSVRIKDKSSEWEQIVERSRKEKALLESAFNFKAIAALDSIYFRDQALRNQISEIEKTGGNHSEKLAAIWRELEKSDAENLKVVEDLISKFGWLKRSSIGYRGEMTLFLVIQHAPLPVQKKYFPMMQAAVKKEEASAINLAYLEDRILVGEGKKQLYGTQLQRNDKTGKYELAPTQDEKNLNIRRAKIGLEPIEVYLKSF